MPVLRWQGKLLFSLSQVRISVPAPFEEGHRHVVVVMVVPLLLRCWIPVHFWMATPCIQNSSSPLTFHYTGCFIICGMTKKDVCNAMALHHHQFKTHRKVKTGPFCKVLNSSSSRATRDPEKQRTNFWNQSCETIANRTSLLRFGTQRRGSASGTNPQSGSQTTVV